MVEWFRRKTWTDPDRADFYARLNRARPNNRAQYARIQAVELIEEPTESNLNGALELLNLVLDSYPDRLQIAAAYHSLGECHALMGRTDDALLNYRQAIEQQRAFPNVGTEAFRDFALLVADCQRAEEYLAALSILDEFGGLEIFPISEFHNCAARALIYRNLEQPLVAVRWARRALNAAEKTESRFRYHKKLGLVGKSDNKRIEQMRRIVEFAGE